MPFDSRVVRSETLEGIATLTIRRPETRNALDPGVVSGLADLFHAAASDPGVDAIVLAASGATFVGGPDPRFLFDHASTRCFEPIVEFMKSTHALLDAIDDCATPVVARVHGPALGAGLELALACDSIVASSDSTFGFPETGIGIYPALGGTQRTPRRVGVGMAKALVLTGRSLDAWAARELGLVDVVVAPESLDAAVRERIDGGSPAHEPGVLRGDAASLARFFAHHSVEDIRTGRVDTGGNEILAQATAELRRKSPVALRIAERLIDDGFDRPLHEGLHLELEHLVEVLSTQEALTGLGALSHGAPELEEK